MTKEFRFKLINLSFIVFKRNIIKFNSSFKDKSFFQFFNRLTILTMLNKKSIDLPAQKISTRKNWNHLVDKKVKNQIQEIQTGLEAEVNKLADIGMDKNASGSKALFYGPSGSGKILAATLLGKYTKKQVYRIDLSAIVSKYIGETEKNLKAIFEKAEHKNWILFFDEADALFGKRTEVKDSNDRYANLEVSYLLQQIEQYNGLVILSAKMKENIDEAFIRRLHYVVAFPPREEEKTQKRGRTALIIKKFKEV
ncbi:hypothetical protein BH23BAC1_BH23BAC1_31500 [soil metagenome]